MNKKLISLVLLVLLAVSPATALAAPGDERVAVGGDLTASQKATVYGFFGLNEGSVEELIVTIEDEKEALGDYVPAEKLGSRSLSSVYITEMDSGDGITVETHNITWVTAEMYMAALSTAGIEDAKVVVAAPTGVSGTAALTGVFKCYESITGETLDEEAKDIASEELIRTGELADLLGSDEAIEFMNQLKQALAESENMSDDELRQIIRDTADQLEVQITDDQVEQLLGLVRRLAKMDLDPQKLLEQAQQIQESLNKIQEAGEKAGQFVTSISNFWDRIVSWFKNLFGTGE